MKVRYQGLTFKTLRFALHNMYFWEEGMSPEEVKRTMEFVLPMQHNFTNPLEGKETDTFIEFWVARDSRWTQDHNEDTAEGGLNVVDAKVADIDIRFVGVEAETWAKAFHHITKRTDTADIFLDLCQGQILEFVGDIIPVNIDYYGVGNSSIAFDLTLKMKYKESVQLNWQRLGLVSLAPGEVVSGSIAPD